jgi:hypothetical protein
MTLQQPTDEQIKDAIKERYKQSGTLAMTETESQQALEAIRNRYRQSR